MELRVWVDGTQRVVCGVKLTTTCQEIVFALAHATQQAGRFTMIERWRNNERLLSPNEQPLVTLQRWGDRMNEVEFILRKTSTDPRPQSDRALPANHLPNTHNQHLSQQNATPNTTPQAKDALTRVTNDSEQNHQPNLINGHSNSPSNQALSTSNQQQLISEQISDNMFRQSRQYDPNRRPQAVIGPLTSSNSALNLGSNFIQAQMNRFSNSFRPSLSTSTLPNVTNNMIASPSNSAAMLRPRYTDDASVGNGSPSVLKNDHHNGYQIQSESQQYQSQQLTNPARVGQAPKNYPHEDLYSTINKKRTNHIPPAVPAKPRLQLNPMASAPHQQPIQTINNAQMNFYQSNPSPLTMYPGNVRPRHPPGYLEYLEAMAHRNSLPPSLMSNPNYLHQAQTPQGNIYQRQLDQHQMYQQNGASPASSSTGVCYPINGQSNRISLGNSFDVGSTSNLQNVNPINPKFVESSGLVINRGSAINVKLHSNSQSASSQNINNSSEQLDNSTQSNTSSVSQMGHDMLKVIEEQKRVLMNQKNELERLDNDQEYLEAKQNSEQAELINRIESEILQLEELWGENQAQIKKLENQDFERELEHMKAEQLRMELELTSQKKKLSKCEVDIAECQEKIERLEADLGNMGSESDESTQDSERSNDRNDISVNSDLKSAPLKSNGSSDLSLNQTSSNKETSCSYDDDLENDSGGDASDDMSTKHLPESKLRNTKEAAYVEKRGLISGIRSLKLDKSRPLNKSIESINSHDLSLSRNSNSGSPTPKEHPSNINNNILEGRCSESNGRQQFGEKTANSNKYEFLMTL